jgi:TRAP-type C4-dicarboxylate transport system permease small subunit
MDELEVGRTIIDYLEIGHTYGESVNDAFDRWISASFAVILLGYFAPERLRLGVTSLIVILYSLYTFVFLSNSIRDMSLSNGVIQDSVELARLHGLEPNLLTAVNEPMGFMAMAVPVLIAGMFLGANAFLIACCAKNLRTKTNKSQRTT